MADRLIELAKAAHRGERPALEELLRATAGLVHALARARVGDTAVADTVTADALARVATGFARLRDPQAYPHWVYRITQRCVARQGGQRRRAGALEAEPADPRGGPAETAVALERGVTIRAAVAALPVNLREPVLLHFVKDMPYREIAEVLGVGLGTVSRRMRRALGALERRLGEER